jgi:hypothetical protein
MNNFTKHFTGRLKWINTTSGNGSTTQTRNGSTAPTEMDRQKMPFFSKLEIVRQFFLPTGNGSTLFFCSLEMDRHIFLIITGLLFPSSVAFWASWQSNACNEGSRTIFLFSVFSKLANRNLLFSLVS